MKLRIPKINITMMVRVTAAMLAIALTAAALLAAVASIQTPNVGTFSLVVAICAVMFAGIAFFYKGNKEDQGKKNDFDYRYEQTEAFESYKAKTDERITQIEMKRIAQKAEVEAYINGAVSTFNAIIAERDNVEDLILQRVIQLESHNEIMAMHLKKLCSESPLDTRKKIVDTPEIVTTTIAELKELAAMEHITETLTPKKPKGRPASKKK